MIDQADRHVYLYAKLHYLHTDTVKDLQQILSVRNGIEAKYIRPKDIARRLLNLASPYIKTPHQFTEFILNLDIDSGWKFSPDPSKQHTFFESVILSCLSILAMTVVVEVGKIVMDLGEADPNILPLKKGATYEPNNKAM